ncbi:MAG TPA: efflux RND transporter periplasmic adaptor subunit [Vicinamibacterales bacterium]
MRTTPMRRHVIAALLLGSLAGCREPESPGTLRVSGNVEATEVQVAPEVGGRLIELNADEGDRVNAGDVIARLDRRDTELQIDRARAERAAAEAQLRLLQAGARPEDIRQAEAQVDAAEAEVGAAEAELRAADMDLARFEALLQANAGSVKQRDDAKARVDVTRERVRAAQERVRAARETVARLRAGARREEVDAARAGVAATSAQIAVLEKALADADVIAPVPGTVTQKLADDGELAVPRTPILVITDLDNAWANLFVPEPMIPRIKLGQPATVFTDAGGEGIPGKVTFVSPRAEFTPRNVQTADERSRLVYRIKVSVDNRDGVLKPGMPVDAELALP